MPQRDLKKNLNNAASKATHISAIGFRRGVAVVLIFISTVILAGWQLRLSGFVKLKDSWPAIAPLTAFNFFTIGVLLLLSPMRGQRPERRQEFLILAIAGMLILTSAAVIARYLLGIEIPLEILIFQRAAEEMGLPFTNIMAPSTALCFLLTGLWFIADFARSRFEVVKSAISLFILIVSFLMLGAYFYGATNLYQLPVFIRMSVLSATFFALTHLAMAVGDPLFGFHFQSPLKFWRDKNTVRERPLYASLLVVFTVFLVTGAATSQSLNRLIQTIHEITETQKHIRELDQLMIGLLNAESAQRGYLLTGQDEYLEPYLEAYRDFEIAHEGLRKWVHENPRYHEVFVKIENTAKIKFGELGETIIWRRAQGLEAAKKVVTTDIGRAAMMTIRDQTNFIKTDLLKILAAQKEDNKDQVARTITSITVGSLLATVLLLTCLNLYVKNSLKRSEIEEEVRDLNHTLEAKLHEIEVVNKELESFSYSVSHDLRAPLRAMAGFSNILIEDYRDKLDEQGRSYLQRIISASDRMARLIDGILDLSRISRRQVRRGDISLSDIAEQHISDLRAMDPHRHVEVVIEPDMKARGDVDLVGALLQNLLMNAWKFTSKKETAHITVGSFVKNSQRVYFVRDDGAGFDMAYAGKLFGTFQRLHKDEDFSGTGVGLATVRRIVHLHGGEVWAEGVVDAGASFYFTLG